MKNRKIAAWSMALIMLIGVLPADIFANPQKPLSSIIGEGIKKVEVKHIDALATGDKEISPDVHVEWNPPPANDPPTTAIVTDNTPNQTYYKFELTDTLNNGAPVYSMQIPANAVNATIQKYMDQQRTFVNGKLYKLRVIPYHTHILKDAADNIIRTDEIGPAAALQPETYFITDLNTKLKDNQGKLEISWEYIPGATYQIVYAKGSKSTKSDMVDQAGADVIAKPGTYMKDMEDTEAKTFLTGQTVKYTVPNSEPGQIYSAYVIVKNVVSSKVPKLSEIHINTQTPKIAQATTSVILSVTNISKGKIRLDWNLGDWLAVTPDLKLTKTTIFQKLKSEGDFTPVGVRENNGVDIGYYILGEPSEEAEYKVQFIAEHQTDSTKNKIITTKTVPYVPYELRVKPLPPQIPKPYNQKGIIDDIKNFLISGDDIDTASEKLKDNTFHVKNINPIEVQLIWGIPLKINSLTERDYDMEYDLWVAEDRNKLNPDAKLEALETIKIEAGQKDNLIYKKDQMSVIGFKWFLKQYVKKDGTKVSFVPNKTYYIKMIAKKNYGKGIYEESDPTIATITLDKDGDIFAPPVLAKPPLKLQEVTTTSAKLRWSETWSEIMPKDKTKYIDAVKKQLDASTAKTADQKSLELQLETFYSDMWHSKVFTQAGSAPYMTEPYLRFIKQGDAINQADEKVLKKSTDVDAVEDIVNRNSATSTLAEAQQYYYNNFIDREVSLGTDTKYEVKFLPYDEVALQLGNSTTTSSIIEIDKLSKWVIEKESDSTAGWTTIAPGAVTEEGLPAKEYTVPGLKANTRYIIMMRAYRIIPGETEPLRQTFPSYVLCTTLSDYESPEAKPKVPVLNFVTKNDTSITVKWLYNKNFDYEIVYSRLQDPNAATNWEFAISDKPGDANYTSDGAEAQVKITGLLPETTYNIWIKAKQKKGALKSEWSNPVTAKTDILGTPEIPTGLGPAAYQSILEIGADFPPVAKDYITVEWIKNSNDIESKETENKLEKQYSYVVEFADNPEFLDAIVVNTSKDAKTGSEVLAKNIVKFTGLIANRPYYVKVKTVLTFNDKEGKREIIKESDYTKWVRILTKKSSDEYDGGDNGNIVIYPEAIIEGYSKDVWTVEIVDTAKIISDLMKKNDYFFTMKVEKYDNRYDAAIRRLKIPKSIIDTLINRGMELKVVTSTGIYEIPAKTLSVYTKQYSAKDIVQFDFTRIEDYKIANILKQYPEKLMKAEQLDIVIKGKSGITAVKKLDGYLKAKIKLDGSKEYLYKNLFAYTYNFDKGAWIKETYSIDTLTDTYISYLTPVTGIYSVYEKQQGDYANLSTYAMTELANTYDIPALGSSYFKNNIVARDQYINLLLGVAQKKSSINLGAAVDSAVLAKAKASGIYISGDKGAVTEEQAIAGIVKLYELKNGYKIKASSVKFNNVSQAYREAVAKAYAVGLIENINPKKQVTYETLCDWILQVTE